MRNVDQERAGRTARLGAAGACAGLALFTAPAALAGSVTTYHNGLTRHGLYTVPGLTASAAASMRLDPGFHATLSGNMHAQPLYWAPKGGTPELIAATESNIVYALNPVTGAIIWQQSLPPPITSGLPCGNINPAGITGTPVIDPATGTLYLNAQTLVSGAPKHMLYALSLADGSILRGWPIDVQAALHKAGVSFAPGPQGARSALLFFKGALYAAYGGRAGDCGMYRGTVVQMDPSTHTLTGNWQTRARGGGVWSQGGISGDGQYLFTTTGNTFEASAWSDGEAILRLLPGLAHSTNPQDYFAPSNWQTLDQEDADLGGTEALPIDLVTERVPGYVPRLVAFGKDGNAYLVRRLNLGGVGGQVKITQVANSQIITAPAIYNTPKATLAAIVDSNGVSCAGGNITMLDLTPSAGAPIKTKWCAALNGRGAPIITTTDGSSNPLVWVAGAEGDNQLHAFHALSGTRIVFTAGNTTMQGLHHFQTMIAADGRLYVGADNTIYAFKFTP